MNETILNYIKNTQINDTNSESLFKVSVGDMLCKKYKVTEKLSVSSSGEADIFKVSSIENNTELVVKIYRRKNSVKKNVINIISSINNKNVSKIIEFGEINGHSYIVLPFYKNGSFETFIKKGFKLDKKNIKPIVKSVIEGLNAIHKSGVLHKDLKPANMMLSDDGSHVKLIDFGISSVTNGQTVVATQTGKTPFYSAPETNAGLFLEESDYYSLGITIYELVTGTTPYQNTSIEDLQKYQQIQQIPFPKNFDKDLKDLVLGLTYKDLTYRNDKSNPNRRWCYEEVKKWLNGEKQPIPGAAQIPNNQPLNQQSQNLSQIPYVFKGKRYFKLKEIVEVFLVNWEDGKKEVFRGHLAKYFEQIEDSLRFKLANNIVLLAESNSNNKDELFFDLMMKLAPEIKKLYWKGFCFKTVYEYGECLVSESLKHQSSNVDLLKTAQDITFLKILKKFAIDKNENKKLNKDLIDNLINLLQSEPLDVYKNAVRVGNALTGKQNFIIGKVAFKSVDEFSSYLLNLYNTDLHAYKAYCDNNATDIKKQTQLLAGNQRIEFQKNLINNKPFLEVGRNKKYYFINILSCLVYAQNLYKNNQLKEFYDFNLECLDQINNICKENHLIIYDEYIKNVNSCLKIRNSIFKNFNHFVEFIKSSSKEEKQEFLRLNHLELFELFGKNPNRRKILEQLFKANLNPVLNNLKVGDKINFGNYRYDPIEWIVLKKNKKTALLITAESIFYREFDKNETSLWTFSSLRKNLNSSFYEQSFSDEEKSSLLKDRYWLFFTDKISIPTVKQVKKYLKKIPNVKSGTFWALASFNLMSVIYILCTLLRNLIVTIVPSVKLIGMIAGGVFFSIGLISLKEWWSVIVGIFFMLVTLCFTLGFFIAISKMFTSFLQYVCAHLRGVTLVDSQARISTYINDIAGYVDDGIIFKDFEGYGNITNVSTNDSDGVRLVIRLKLDD